MSYCDSTIKNLGAARHLGFYPRWILYYSMASVELPNFSQSDLATFSGPFFMERICT